MIHARMSEEECATVIDYILDTIDPVDRKSSFLAMAKTWKDLMSKFHGQNQTTTNTELSIAPCAIRLYTLIKRWLNQQGSENLWAFSALSMPIWTDLNL